jgi:predicted Rossmann-fold nucleotide-binding protein
VCQVLGIVPKSLAKENIIRKIIGEELKVLTISKRITTILEHLNYFIALPGNLGILEKIF